MKKGSENYLTRPWAQRTLGLMTHITLTKPALSLSRVWTRLCLNEIEHGRPAIPCCRKFALATFVQDKNQWDHKRKPAWVSISRSLVGFHATTRRWVYRQSTGGRADRVVFYYLGPLVASFRLLYCMFIRRLCRRRHNNHKKSSEKTKWNENYYVECNHSLQATHSLICTHKIFALKTGPGWLAKVIACSFARPSGLQ